MILQSWLLSFLEKPWNIIIYYVLDTAQKPVLASEREARHNLRYLNTRSTPKKQAKDSNSKIKQGRMIERQGDTRKKTHREAKKEKTRGIAKEREGNNGNQTVARES